MVTATLSSTRDVTLETGGGTIAPDAGVTASLGGDITGDGELTKIDDGTLILTGTNDYSGGTNVFGGVLRGSTTSLQGDITDNAILVFDQGSTGTYAGEISGTGSLTKLGTGTLVLTGTSDYSGGTNVFSGTLQVSTTSLQGVIQNDAILVFDQDSTGTYAGAITGSGSLTKIGTGTLILAGVNDYFGGTTVSAGTLQGSTTEPAGRHHATMPVWSSTQGSTGTYAGDITGTGSLTKLGAGTLILAGSNSYSGGTLVERRHAAGHDRRACRATSPTTPAWSSTRSTHRRPMPAISPGTGLADQARNRHGDPRRQQQL